MIAASVSARLSGVAVEDLSQRSGSVRVWVNPDGTLTQESHASPVWVQSDDGRWVDVDYTLVQGAGSAWVPRAAPTAVVIAGGGGREFARMELPGGGSTVWSWPAELPAPVVEGASATYSVSDGVDLVVTASALGVSSRIRIATADAVAPEFTVEVRTEGGGLEESGQGGLYFTDGAGRSGQSTTLLAWDGRRDVFGDPVEFVPVEASVEETGSDQDAVEHELTLTTPPEMVSDPEVVYPITIDPDIAPLSPAQDTWVRRNTAGIEGSYRLLVGRLGDSANTYQTISYAQWDNAEIAGRKILSARLSLYQYAAGSCAARELKIFPLGEAWDESTTVFANKPSAITGSGYTSSLTKNVGGAGCSAPNGVVTADVTKLVQAWADGPGGGGLANHGIQLSVPSDSSSDASYERRFCSTNFDPTHTSCTSAARVPFLSVTYNSAPLAPKSVSVSSSRSYDGSVWTSDSTPLVSVAASDPEGSRVTYDVELRESSSSPVVTAGCTSSVVASGATGSCEVSSALADGQLFVARARAQDEHGLVGEWSPWQPVGVDTSAPTTPSIGCEDVSDQTWYPTRPAAEIACTFTASGVADFEWRRSEAGTVEDQPAVVATAGSGTAASFGVPTTGVVRVEARSRSKAGLASAWRTFTFGVGSAAITQPMLDDRSTSTFPVQASAGGGATSARVEWRYAPDAAGDTTTGWATATHVQVRASGASWTGSLAATSPLSQAPLLTWTPSAETGISVPSVVQVRVVFGYPAGVEMPSPLQRVQLIPHAFGGSYPTQDVGPGTLALFTGEYQLSETDVSVPGVGGDLTFGRTHGTLTGDLAGPAGVFGPGWTADFAGEGAGMAGFVVTDNTALDGSIILTSPEGDSYVYAHASGTRGGQQLGSYEGVGETALALDDLQLAAGGGSGISHTLTLTELDGTITEWKRTTAGVWSITRTVEPEDDSTVTFARDSGGFITWIFSPAPDGVTCNETTQAKGCRALKFTYSTIAGTKRVTKVQYRAWDPKPGSDGKPTAAAAMATIDVAGYGYDASGVLVEAWQPQSSGDTGTGHKVAYSYTTINSKTVLATLSDPGLVPWRFAYDNVGRLATIARAQDAAVGAGDATWTVAYDTPLSGAGLPDLTAGSVVSWGQLAADAPTGATAVFGPDRSPAGPPGESDWPYASISYFTQAGRVTNTAAFGAGVWLVDSTRYDADGNTTWALSAAGRALALTEDDPASAADKYATFTVYNAAGTRIEASYSPMREVVLDNGDTLVARTVVSTDFDDEADTSLMPGRPTTGVPDAGFMLAVEQRTAVTDKLRPSADGNTYDTRRLRYRYDPVVAGDASGWALRVPTRTLTQDGDGWATTLTRYDAEGRVLETRTPGGTAITNGTANDTYSTRYIAYTADGSASTAACRNKPEWAGNPCLTKTAGDPATGYPIPATSTTGYTILGSATRLEQTASTWTRGTITGFDYLGRPTSDTVSLTDHSSITGTTTYQATTGVVTASTGNGLTQNYTYDTWGRQLTATDGTGNTATTTYNAVGDVATFNDGKGAYAYGYDGTDNQGRTERRGLITSVDLGYATGSGDTITASYDPAGNLTHQQLPDGYAADTSFDLAGQATSLSYTHTVDGATTGVLGFTQTYDHLGRVNAATSPAGTRRYTYDDRARLATVRETTAVGCTTRSYTFTGDSNRTRLDAYEPDTDGSCQTTTPNTTTNYSYDQADRITTTGYAYDRMGRTTTLPKAHSSQAGTTAGDATITYHANDMVASIQQAIPNADTGTSEAHKQTFALDAGDRISIIRSYTDNVQVREALNHYDSDSDNPAWTQTKTRPDASAAWDTTWERYLADLGGGLALTTDNTGGTTLSYHNLHGDIVATTTLGRAGLDSYAETDEYGNPTNPTETHDRYGWLGSHQRDTGTTLAGVVLMGVRLYSPFTGTFLSVDSVIGGNANRYGYPADPINDRDTTGMLMCHDGESFHDCQVRHGNAAHAIFSEENHGPRRKIAHRKVRKVNGPRVIPDGKVRATKNTPVSYAELKPNRRSALAAARRTVRITGRATVAVIWKSLGNGKYSYTAVGIYKPGAWNPVRGLFGSIRVSGNGFSYGLSGIGGGGLKDLMR